MPYVPGPFIGPHLYLQWGGKLPGNEEWSCGLRMSPINTGDVASAAAMLPGVTAAVQAFHSSPDINTNARALLSFVKLNAIGTDGKYVLPTTNEQIVADVPGSATAANCPPNQVAHAITLTTAVSRGPAHQGRFYLPLPTYTIQPDGRILALYTDSIHGAVTSFLAALNGVNANFKVAVYSRKLGAPAQRLVTGAKVGRVLDTQRRRRRSLVEAYT